MNISEHLEELGASGDLSDLGKVVTRLRSLSEIEPSPVLTGRIMNSLDCVKNVPGSTFRHSRSSGMKPWIGAAAAAAVVVALFAFRSIFLSQIQSDIDPGSGHERWLARCQELDGSWNPGRHGGSGVYRPALTALSALALFRSGEGYGEEVRKARDYLQSIQQQDGSFGGQGRERFYNQAIVTYVLARTATRKDPLEPLQKAAGVIARAQGVQGGWDYVEGSEGNAAITAWQIEALAAANDAGVMDVDVSVKKGLRWLRTMTGSDGRVAYNRGSPQASDTVNALAAHTLLTAGAAFPELNNAGLCVAAALIHTGNEDEAQDLYRDCMKVRALKAAGESYEADALRNRVAATSAEAASDQWGKVGGRLYVASLSSLARTF